MADQTAVITPATPEDTAARLAALEDQLARALKVMEAQQKLIAAQPALQVLPDHVCPKCGKAESHYHSPYERHCHVCGNMWTCSNAHHDEAVAKGTLVAA